MSLEGAGIRGKRGRHVMVRIIIERQIEPLLLENPKVRIYKIMAAE
jgi:hypothetical protein